ncbi:MAG: response regulator [Flavobacteriales bacterium]|jgi:two-component system LytT family response regulator|nr:response regulator [Flavobacteriales bacterium]
MITAIIVDDEKSARNVLNKLLLVNHPEVNVLDQCSDLLSAVASIKKQKPDVVFLDIEMPVHSGFEIVEYFDTIDFEIIFITAYDKYAIKAFEIAALDYILKPIEVERLAASITKLSKNVALNTISERLKLLSETINSNEVNKLYVFHKGERHILEVSKIIAIEAKHAYCNIYVSGKNEVFMISKNLKHVTQLLDDNTQFYRTHRSWLINVNRMKSYVKSKGVIMLEESIEARLSKYKCEDFEQYIKSR